MIYQSLTGEWKFRKASTDEWLKATVPGGVHTDLMAAGKIPDPFVGDNEKRVRWVAESDWEYQRLFSVNPELLEQEKIHLVCDGLDTLAEVSVNNVLLGKTDNMFRQYIWDIKSLLRPGENNITVYFHSPVQYITAKQAENPMRGVVHAIPGGPHLRKAPCQFGWDWGPQLPPIGIWKDIRLEAFSLARLEDVILRQKLLPGKAILTVGIRAEKSSATPIQAMVEVKGTEGEAFSSTGVLHGEKGEITISIPNPRLWWPNGYGEQTLYLVKVSLVSENGELDSREYRIGFRSIELRQEPDQWGKSFTFVVNSVPIFAKGSDWIPADSFPTRLTDEHLEHLIRSAAMTHQNMLRVWGGGFYEEDRFYDLCDRYGILIWQDMIYSCSIYPLHDPDFLATVEIETRQNVRRLRHHACLALWCGNNEMEEGWEFWGWDTPENALFKVAYGQFFYFILPTWIKEEDPDHEYWPSSPSANTPFKNTQAQFVGDAHYWEVWHRRKPFSAYRDQYPRFMSEFGFQSLPPFETIKTYAEAKDWNMTSYIMEHHQKNAAGNGLMIHQMTELYRMPKDFQSLVYMTMVLQAEGIRYGVEHWRRNRDRVSGTLYWQLNDCWPVASWASLDYFGRWKALHYEARRFYAPLLLSLLDNGNKVDIHITSDLVIKWSGVVRWSLQSVNGDVIQSGEIEVLVPPLKDIEVVKLDLPVPADREREMILVAELLEGNRRISLAVTPFVPNKHLELVEPGISFESSLDGDMVSLQLKSTSLARFVELSLEGVDVVFSDNYFDLPAGYPATITFTMPMGWTLQEVNDRLRVRSLYHSYI